MGTLVVRYDLEQRTVYTDTRTSERRELSCFYCIVNDIENLGGH